jgi:hypothetical protein
MQIGSALTLVDYKDLHSIIFIELVFTKPITLAKNNLKHGVSGRNWTLPSSIPKSYKYMFFDMAVNSA